MQSRLYLSRVCLTGHCNIETVSVDPRPAGPACDRDQGAGVLQQVDHPFQVRALSHLLKPRDLTPCSDLKVFLGPGVLTTVGAQHRRQRKLLNPVFSVAHLRNMTHIFYNVAHKVRAPMSSITDFSQTYGWLPLQMRNALAIRVLGDGQAKVLDINGWMARTTLEMLGQAGLGYSFDNFVEDSSDPYGESIKMFLWVLYLSLYATSPLT